MFNHKNLLGRVVTICTFAIIFSILGDIVMPTLIVETVHAQSITSSTVTSQTKLSPADQKELDKIQADAKAANYKDLGLTPAEIIYSNDKTIDKDSINQKIDKFVKYKNGIAKLDANGFRQSPAKLSKINTELAISIANKMIGKYNSLVNNIDQILSPIKNSTNSKSSVNNISTSNIIKTNLERGFSLKNKSSSLGVTASAMSNNSTGFEYIQWWGYRLYVTNEMVNQFTNLGIGQILSIIVALPAAWVLCVSSPYICAGLAAYIGINAYWMVSMNRQCGRRGIYINGAYWTGYAPIVTKIC